MLRVNLHVFAQIFEYQSTFSGAFLIGGNYLTSQNALTTPAKMMIQLVQRSQMVYCLSQNFNKFMQTSHSCKSVRKFFTSNNTKKQCVHFLHRFARWNNQLPRINLQNVMPKMWIAIISVKRILNEQISKHILCCTYVYFGTIISIRFGLRYFCATVSLVSIQRLNV